MATRTISRSALPTDDAFARTCPAARLVHGAVPESVFQRWNVQRKAMGLSTFDPTLTYHMRGVPDETIDVTIDTSSVAKRVVAGLLEHRSQQHVIFDQPIDPERWEKVVVREWWTIAPLPAERVMLTDLFEGL